MVKTHMPIFPYSFGKMNFVWRQLRLAFFGALTSVGALFVFIERGKNMDEQNKYVEKPETEIPLQTENQEVKDIKTEPIKEKSAKTKKQQNMVWVVITAVVSVLVLVAAIIVAVVFLNNDDTSAGMPNNSNVTHTHEFSEWQIIKEATCTYDGSQKRYCSCGKTQTEVIYTTAHNFGEWTETLSSTCTENGVKKRICVGCSKAETSDLPLIDHSFSAWETVTNSTCIKNGVKKRTCSGCSKVETSDLPLADHSFSAWVTTNSTCINNGVKSRKCSSCARVETESLPLSDHNIVQTVSIKATSTSAGTMLNSCSVCTYTYTESYTLSILSSEEIYEIAQKSVGEIVTYSKSNGALALGTVFVYSQDGKLITNYHVIEDAYSAIVTIDNREYNVVSILAYDKDIDLAVIKISASDLTPLPIQCEGIKGGATVYAAGSSEGYTLSFSSGIVASPSREFDGVSYIQHEAPISHGNSGGPLFNAYGEVVGINTLTNIDGQNLNFAISCSEIDNLVFGSTLTFAQFYEKECDPFTRIKNYIIENGTYDSEDGEYELLTNTSYSGDYTYRRKLYYDVADNEIRFSLFVNANYLVSFYLDEEISGEYFWIYVDSNDYTMYGTLYASTYTDNTLLGYSYNNISYSSLRNSVRELASSMMDIIVKGINVDLESLGITAADLGFVRF